MGRSMLPVTMQINICLGLAELTPPFVVHRLAGDERRQSVEDTSRSARDPAAPVSGDAPTICSWTTTR